MQKLNLPEYAVGLVARDNGDYVFDIVRKKYLKLTPEEWVRQNWVHHLHYAKGYPLALISIESGLKVNRNSNRTDIVCFDREGRKRLLVECKAPEVRITQKVFDQIARYNITIGADLLLVTNGLTHYCCQYSQTEGRYVFLSDLPDFSTLLHGIQ